MEYDESKIIKFIPKYMDKNGHYSIEISFITEELVSFKSVFSGLDCLYKTEMNSGNDSSTLILYDNTDSNNSIFILKTKDNTELTITGDEKWFLLIFESIIIDIVNGNIYFYFNNHDEDVVAYSSITSFTLLK